MHANSNTGSAREDFRPNRPATRAPARTAGSTIIHPASVVLTPQSVEDFSAQLRDVLSPAVGWLPVEVLAQTGSTNADLLERSRTQQDTPCALVALSQTAGRGRSGRSWESDHGSLTFSICWPFARSAAALSGLPLAVAVAVCEGLDELGVSGLAIKWPNDLLRHGQKLGGILVELSGSTAVIGIGLNVRMNPLLLDRLDQPACDVQPQQGPVIRRAQVLAAVLQRLVPALQRFDVEGFAGFQAHWMRRGCWLGRPVRLGGTAGVTPEVSGVFAGVDDRGAALITKDGVTERHLAGDLSLRPC